MEQYIIGTAYIPVTIIGGVLNIFALVRLIKFKHKNNSLHFGNFENLLLALIISDLLRCTVSSPIKIVLYLLNRELFMLEWRYVRDIDIFCQFASLLMLAGIALNNYFKVTKTHSKYDSMLTKRRVKTFIIGSYMLSLLIPVFLFMNTKFALSTACLTVIFERESHWTRKRKPLKKPQKPIHL